ncbi:MAG TPA: AsmA-like C-terminal region-containing protein [Vicinamibacterales bacterium]
MKRVAIAVVVLLGVAGIGLTLFARSVLTGDHIRSSVAAQVSAALGQPVTIGSLGVSVYPRVTMDLGDVSIGEAGQIRLASMHLGTGLRALFSRRIEHAAVRIDGARITLPLPPFNAAPSGEAGSSGSLPVEIVSIDEVVLRNVDVIGGDRTLHGDIELVPQDTGAQIRRIALSAGDTRIEMTGALTSVSPIEGRLEATANTVDIDRLLAFLDDFTAAASSSITAAASTSGVDGRLTIVMKADRAITGGLTLTGLAATATVLPDGVTFEPLAFGIFGGRYEGTMHVALGDAPAFAWRASVAGIDTAALMAFAGSPGTITGTLSGTVSLEGTGLEMERALRTARGTARVDITDGTITGLSLVRTVVTAGSGRGGLLTSVSKAAADRAEDPGSERFSRLGATLALAGGRLTTSDMAMTSADVDLNAAGAVRVDTMTAEFAGTVRLSEALSKESGTDLYELAQEDGRVTLPVTLTGPIDNLTVRLDAGDAAARAIRNRAADEAKKALERNLPKGLRGLIRKKGGQP